LEIPGASLAIDVVMGSVRHTINSVNAVVAAGEDTVVSFVEGATEVADGAFDSAQAVAYREALELADRLEAALRVVANVEPSA
jgi:hypothetical protein